MVPNFALDLSEDGIVLLHRDPEGTGWHVVAEVSLDDPDLSGALSGLKAKAEAFEGPDFTTKLVLPPSQLLYASIPVGHNVQGDVERALETRTPYTIEQLSYDIRGTAPEVQVVAVARETLAEAESFIAPYGLNAVGFTASPDQTLFPGEPNLGMTELGETLGFETDRDPVQESPEVEEPEAEDAPEEVAAAEDAPVDEDPVEEEIEGLAEALAEDDEPVEDTPEDADEEPEEDTSAVEEASEADAFEAPDETEDDAPEDLVASEDAVAEEPADAPVSPDEPEAPEAEEEEDAPGISAPAAFSSRRRGGDASPETTGERVTKLSARMSIPDKAPKLGGAKPKSLPKTPRLNTPKVAPVLTETERQVPPPIVPVRDGEVAKVETPKADAPSRFGFSSKGRAKAKKAAGADDPIADLAAKQAAAKPRRLGLILTLILLVALGLFAALSSLLLPEDSVARLFGGGEDEATGTVEFSVTEVAPEITDEEAADIELAALPSEPFDEVTPGFAEPLNQEPANALPPPAAQMTIEDAETAYALNGIWQKAPDIAANTVATRSTDDLYIPSLDPALAFEDAPALASFPSETNDVLTVNPVAPPPPDARFAFDERGLIRPSVQGTLSPEGVMIFLGAPPVRAIPRPEDRVTEEEEDVEEVTGEDNRLAGIRPAPRPDNLIETNERATLNGLSRAELAAIRPAQRPQSAQAQAEAIARAVAEAEAETETETATPEILEDPAASATRLAVASSGRPATRPRNFARVVEAARKAAQTAPRQSQQPAAVQSASASTAAAPSRGTGPAVARSSRTNPTGPTRATVARAATDNNALALGKVALVGVFGTSSNRRALVRMPNGRFKKVSVGDRVDGGRVRAIGDGQLRYTKGGRTVTLKMPKG